MKAALRLVAGLGLAAPAAAQAPPQSQLTLTTDWAEEETAVVEGPAPDFRWVVPPLATRGHGVTQASYRVQVRRVGGGGNVSVAAWDSGVVASNASGATYPATAPALREDSAYRLLVQATLSDGSALTGAGGFRTGLQSASRSAWGGAEWIAGDATVPATAAMRRNNLRAEWALEGSPSDASAFVAGVGYHELFCNGERQGNPNAKLQPGFTHYEKRTYYVLYSLSACLKKGKNVLGVSLGNGWYSQGVAGSKHTAGGSQMPHARASPPQLLLRARATVGSKDELLVSSTAWQAASGPIIEDSLYNGELI